MASIFGRAVIVTKTNKSGGSLAKGDVVVIDGGNDNAVTTTTTGGTTVTVGVVVEENGIANNASGRVQFGGHVGLVTVNASVTRGHYGYTHTVAKQAADAGASRVVGTFCLFTTGGTTPEADLYSQPDASSASGNMATDALWDAKGDLAAGTGANTGAKLTAGSNGMVPVYDSAQSQGLKTAYPPGYEWDFDQATSDLNPTATTEGTAQTAVTGNAVTYDGSPVIAHFVCSDAQADASAGAILIVLLYEGATVIGRLAIVQSPTAAGDRKPISPEYRFTPSAASHTYSVKAYVTTGTGALRAGAGGSGNSAPMFMRITKV